MSDSPALADLLRAHPKMSLRAFCETYLGEWFSHPWWSSQIGMIRELDQVVRHGSSREHQMERGKGSTTLLLGAALSALACCHRRRVGLLAETTDTAHLLVENIVQEAKHNLPLQRDFSFGYVGRHGATYVFHVGDGECHLYVGSLNISMRGMRPNLLLLDNAVDYESRSPATTAKQEKLLGHYFHQQPTFSLRSVEYPL